MIEANHKDLVAPPPRQKKDRRVHFLLPPPSASSSRTAAAAVDDDDDYDANNTNSKRPDPFQAHLKSSSNTGNSRCHPTNPGGDPRMGRNGARSSLSSSSLSTGVVVSLGRGTMPLAPLLGQQQQQQDTAVVDSTKYPDGCSFVLPLPETNSVGEQTTATTKSKGKMASMMIMSPPEYLEEYSDTNDKDAGNSVLTVVQQQQQHQPGSLGVPPPPGTAVADAVSSLWWCGVCDILRSAAKGWYIAADVQVMAPSSAAENNDPHSPVAAADEALIPAGNNPVGSKDAMSVDNTDSSTMVGTANRSASTLANISDCSNDPADTIVDISHRHLHRYHPHHDSSELWEEEIFLNQDRKVRVIQQKDDPDEGCEVVVSTTVLDSWRVWEYSQQQQQVASRIASSGDDCASTASLSSDSSNDSILPVKQEDSWILDTTSTGHHDVLPALVSSTERCNLTPELTSVLTKITATIPNNGPNRDVLLLPVIDAVYSNRSNAFIENASDVEASIQSCALSDFNIFENVISKRDDAFAFLCWVNRTLPLNRYVGSLFSVWSMRDSDMESALDSSCEALVVFRPPEGTLNTQPLENLSCANCDSDFPQGVHDLVPLMTYEESLAGSESESPSAAKNYSISRNDNENDHCALQSDVPEEHQMNEQKILQKDDELSMVKTPDNLEHVCTSVALFSWELVHQYWVSNTLPLNRYFCSVFPVEPRQGSDMKSALDSSRSEALVVFHSPERILPTRSLDHFSCANCDSDVPQGLHDLVPSTISEVSLAGIESVSSENDCFPLNDVQNENCTLMSVAPVQHQTNDEEILEDEELSVVSIPEKKEQECVSFVEASLELVQQQLQQYEANGGAMSLTFMIVALLVQLTFLKMSASIR